MQRGPTAIVLCACSGSPSRTGWSGTKVSTAREGGFSVRVLDSPEQPMMEALERIADEGPEYYPGAHAASLAHDDWFRTLGQLKKAARRRYTPDRHAPSDDHADRQLGMHRLHVPRPKFPERPQEIPRQIRSKTRTPCQWHWSRTFQLPKRNPKKRPPKLWGSSIATAPLGSPGIVGSIPVPADLRYPRTFMDMFPIAAYRMHSWLLRCTAGVFAREEFRISRSRKT
eukprot:9482754-Pyramimonas_sp.AAC.1